MKHLKKLMAGLAITLFASFANAQAPGANTPTPPPKQLPAPVGDPRDDKPSKTSSSASASVECIGDEEEEVQTKRSGKAWAKAGCGQKPQPPKPVAKKPVAKPAASAQASATATAAAEVATRGHLVVMRCDNSVERVIPTVEVGTTIHEARNCAPPVAAAATATVAATPVSAAVRVIEAPIAPAPVVAQAAAVAAATASTGTATAGAAAVAGAKAGVLPGWQDGPCGVTIGPAGNPSNPVIRDLQPRPNATCIGDRQLYMATFAQVCGNRPNRSLDADLACGRAIPWPPKS